MKQATEIFAKHWTKATGKALDDATKYHMKYAIEAVNEALNIASVSGKRPKLEKILLSYKAGIYNTQQSLNMIQAACASSAVDKTVSGGCERCDGGCCENGTGYCMHCENKLP